MIRDGWTGVVMVWPNVAVENTAVEWVFVAAGLELDHIHHGQNYLECSCEDFQMMKSVDVAGGDLVAHMHVARSRVGFAVGFVVEHSFAVTFE